MGDTTSLVEHSFRSVRKWLNQMFPDDDIWIGRPRGEYTRPSFVIHAGNREARDRGRHLTEQVVDWQIEYLAELDPDYHPWRAERVVEQIEERLKQSMLIPLYLHSWKHPDTMVEVDGGGNLDAGSVSVRVSAINGEGEESLPSDSQVAAVIDGSSLKIYITAWPRWSPVAKEFRVYAGAEGSETLQGSLVIPDDYPTSIPHVYSLDELVVGDSPPTSSVFFYRFLRVEDISTVVLQHPKTDGLWNGSVMFKTCVLSSRFYQLARTIGEVNLSIDGSE